MKQDSLANKKGVTITLEDNEGVHSLVDTAVKTLRKISATVESMAPSPTAVASRRGAQTLASPDAGLGC